MVLYDEFMREIRVKNRANNTISVLEQVFNKTHKALEKPIEDVTFDELLTYIEGLKKSLSKSSIQLYIQKYIQFYKFCFDKTDDIKYEKMVKKLKKINTGVEKSYINPSDILFPEDIKKLINVATLERDRCILSVLFESGMRSGELLALTNNMVVMDEKTQEVIFNIPNDEGCKTGGRTIVCLEIYGYVQDWQKCNTSYKFMPISKAGLKKILINLFDKAGIKKPNNPHNFRHSAITHTVNLGMQQSSISMRFWGIVNSNMLSTYIHLNEQMQATSYRNAKGMNGNDTKVINPLASKCVNCGRLIQKGNMCITCKENAELKERVKKLENIFIGKSDEVINKMFYEYMEGKDKK